MSKQKG